MIRAFRIIGILEGLSFLTLLGIAMPLKYVYGDPTAVRFVGMGHGLLFIAYVGLAFSVSDKLGWPPKRLFLAMAAAVLPFGTFMFDRKFLAHSPGTR